MPGSIGDQFNVQTESETKVIIDTLFPSNNKFQRLQMITEISDKARPLLSGLGVIRRRWELKNIGSPNSFDVLKVWQEEFGMNGLALNRKSRLELEEVLIHRTSKDENYPDSGRSP